jgi:hypothetical protein
MKKKLLGTVLAITLIMPVITWADDDEEDENNASYTITSVSPATVENLADTTITITGTGFSTITTVGARLGEWEDDEKDDTDDTFPLTNVTVVNNTTITATVPQGAEAEDEEDVTVYDSGVTPNTHYTLEDAITIHPSFEIDDEDGDEDGIVETDYSRNNSAKVFFNLTLQGKTIKKKRWLKVRVGRRPAKIVSLAKVGGATRIRARLNYGKMAAGQYNIKLTYKDRLTKRVRRNGKWKYRKHWENGTIASNNAFAVAED